MSAPDDRFQHFEFPKLLLEVGQVLDRALASGVPPEPSEVALRIELDTTTAAAFRRTYRASKARILNAVQDHLVYRGRSEDAVRLELFDASSDLPTLFTVEAGFMQIDVAGSVPPVPAVPEGDVSPTTEPRTWGTPRRLL